MSQAALTVAFLFCSIASAFQALSTTGPMETPSLVKPATLQSAPGGIRIDSYLVPFRKRLPIFRWMTRRLPSAWS